MPVSVKLPSEFQGIFQNLFKQDPIEGTIRLVLNELRKKLTEYTLMDKFFESDIRWILKNSSINRLSKA